MNMKYRKNRLKRTLAIWLTCAILATLLQACGIQPTPSSEPIRPLNVTTQAPSTAERVTASATLPPTVPTITQGPTRTPRRHTPIRSMETLTPTSTVTPTPRPEAVDGLLGAPLMLQYVAGDEVYLQDVATGERRRLDPKISFGEYDQFLGWTRQGCGFYYRANNYNIVELDLHGDVIRTVFSAEKLKLYRGEGEVSEFVLLSPSEEWVAFMAGQGERTSLPDRYEYHYASENVFVMASDGSAGPFQISQNGGAWAYFWSPDSTKLAYLDYDRDGNFQVYVANYDGSERSQLTHFTTDTSIGDYFLWSPDGKHIEIDSYLDVSSEYNLFLAAIQSEQVIFLKKVGAPSYSSWDDGVFLLWKDDQIEWLDPSTGEIIRQRSGVPNFEKMRWPGRFDSGKKMGYFSATDDKFYIYDIEANSLNSWPAVTKLTFLAGWQIAPDAFPGEAACSP